MGSKSSELETPRRKVGVMQDLVGARSGTIMSGLLYTTLVFKFSSVRVMSPPLSDRIASGMNVPVSAAFQTAMLLMATHSRMICETSSFVTPDNTKCCVKQKKGARRSNASEGGEILQIQLARGASAEKIGAVEKSATGGTS